MDQIACGISGIGRLVGKCIHFWVKGMVQGQGQRETFSKKVKLGTSTTDRESQLEYKVAHGQPNKIC